MWTPARSLLVAAAMAAGLAAVPASRAEDVGLSTERLQRIPQLVQRYIDRRPDYRRGNRRVAQRAGWRTSKRSGLMDIESKAPMRKDAIFRMASMTKPVTGVAILMLMEEGKLRLTDPVSRFIPEFKNMKVAMLKPVPTAPARRRRLGASRRSGNLHGPGGARDHDPRSA